MIAVRQYDHRCLVLQTLVRDELSLDALSRALQTPLNLLQYLVAKCTALGVIAVVRDQRRAGQMIKHYRETGRLFFLPAALIVKSMRRAWFCAAVDGVVLA
jgi:predicted GTPase